MNKAWILVGMMGAGKSATGRRLAEGTGRAYQDTDTLLQNRFGRPVAGIFATYGEQTFREHETSILKGLEPGPIVLATGGGIVLREENWREMKRLGPTLYLRATPETLICHLSSSQKKRPLLEVEDWEERLRTLLSSRIPFYERADLVVDIDDLGIEQVAQLTERAFRSMEE